MSDLSPKLKKQCLERDGYRCQAQHIAPNIPCGGVLHVDHIRNRSTHPHLKFDLDNLQTLCWKCHMVKGDKVWAAKVLGVFGEEARDLLDPNEEETQLAHDLWSNSKKRL